MLTSLKGHLALARKLRMQPTSLKDDVAIYNAFESPFSYHRACNRIRAFQAGLVTFKRGVFATCGCVLLGVLIGGPAVLAVASQH